MAIGANSTNINTNNENGNMFNSGGMKAVGAYMSYGTSMMGGKKGGQSGVSASGSQGGGMGGSQSNDPYANSLGTYNYDQSPDTSQNYSAMQRRYSNNTGGY